MRAWFAAGRAPGRRSSPAPGSRRSGRARLADHSVATRTLEPERSGLAGVIDDPPRLAALVSACAVLEAALPERQPMSGVFDATESLLDALEGDVWDAAYVGWELGLLGALGFGLDLTRCAATGATAELTHVSPRTGRAVSAGAAAPYADRLLPLPGFLIGRGEASPEAVLAGLDLTGHFPGAAGCSPSRTCRCRRPAPAMSKPIESESPDLV